MAKKKAPTARGPYELPPVPRAISDQANVIVALIARDITENQGISPLLWADEEQHDRITRRWKTLVVATLMREL